MKTKITVTIAWIIMALGVGLMVFILSCAPTLISSHESNIDFNFWYIGDCGLMYTPTGTIGFRVQKTFSRNNIKVIFDNGREVVLRTESAEKVICVEEPLWPIDGS